MLEPTTFLLLISLILFLIGIGTGWKINKEEDTFTKANLQVAVGILVTAVWVASIAAEIIIPAYTVSVLVHGIMGAVVGYLFSDDGLDITIGGG